MNAAGVQLLLWALCLVALAEGEHSSACPASREQPGQEGMGMGPGRASGCGEGDRTIGNGMGLWGMGWDCREWDRAVVKGIGLWRMGSGCGEWDRAVGKGMGL